MSGNPYTPSESFTVRTVAGEEIEIVGKIPGDQRVILVTAEDQRYVSTEQGSGLVEPYDPEKHGASSVATGNAAAKWGPAADATDAAEARAAFGADLPADATEAAEAEAALEADLAQSPNQPLPVPEPSDGEPEPPVAEAEPTPEVDGTDETS